MIIRLLMTNLTAEQWVELSGAEKYHIGREEGELVVLDSKCSRKHALLCADSNGDLIIRDLGSSNGTFVNQEKISEIKPVSYTHLTLPTKA